MPDLLRMALVFGLIGVGGRFDLREFNRTVLEEGVVPLSELRLHVTAWISSKRAAGK